MLSKHPEHAEKVYQELLTCDTADVNALASLPHLGAVMNETMRLLPAAMTGANRLTSDQGLWIDDTFLPGNIKVAAPKYSIMRRSYSQLPLHMSFPLPLNPTHI